LRLVYDGATLTQAAREQAGRRDSRGPGDAVRDLDALKVLDLLRPAEKLLEDLTGAQLVSEKTEGAGTTAAMRVLELTLRAPRGIDQEKGFKVARTAQNRIGGKDVGAAKHFTSVNPCDHKQVIGRFPQGTKEDAERAVEAAAAAFPAWSRVAAEERSALLLRIAAMFRRRKHELSAMMVLEESKSWAEGDADTAESIDFCEFYAREMERLAQPQPLTPYPGEKNELEFIPLGVCAVIPPWNFHLAILTGMAAAAIVTGNTVVLKPSSDAAAIATLFLETCEEAGIPDGVLHFVTGPASTVGNTLVEQPNT